MSPATAQRRAALVPRDGFVCADLTMERSRFTHPTNRRRSAPLQRQKGQPRFVDAIVDGSRASQDERATFALPPRPGFRPDDAV